MGTQAYGGSALVRRALVLLALSAVAVVLTVGIAIADRATVLDRIGLAEVAYGLPFEWLHQDATQLDPPFPYETGVQDPRDFPTEVSLGPLLADAGIVLAAELLLLATWTQVARRNRPGR